MPTRCDWADTDPLLLDYHDNEWGRPERDSRALWERAVAVTEKNYLAHNNLGVFLERNGEVEEACGHFALAWAYRPSAPQYCCNLARVLIRGKDPAATIAAADQAAEALKADAVPLNLDAPKEDRTKGDRLVILRERGELVIAPASPDAFRPLARAQILSGTVRAYPALSDGFLYARNDNTLICLDLRR